MIEPTIHDATEPSETAVAAWWRSTLTLVLAVGVLVPSFFGFGTKFLEFIQIYTGQVDGAFAIGPILNYLLASAGFLLLLLWGTLNGMFHDIEQPKYDLLLREEQIDAQSWPRTPCGPESRASLGLGEM